MDNSPDCRRFRTNRPDLSSFAGHVGLTVPLVFIAVALSCSSYRYTDGISTKARRLSLFCEPVCKVQESSSKGQKYHRGSTVKVEARLKAAIKETFGRGTGIVGATPATRKRVAALVSKLERTRHLDEVSVPSGFGLLKKAGRNQFVGIVYLDGYYRSGQDQDVDLFDALSGASMQAGSDIYFLCFAVVDPVKRRVVYYDRRIRAKSPLDADLVRRDLGRMHKNYLRAREKAAADS